MGPRPLSHGNDTSARDDGTLTQLQWGRDLSVTETSLYDGETYLLMVLQWGRDLSVTETRLAYPEAMSASYRFNGAATSQSRKLSEKT